MATWGGWIIQLLGAAGIINTPPNQTFMEQWAAHDGPACKNAPVTLSTKVQGSTRCGATVTPLGRTQNYPTHAAAAHAFALQMALARMKPLRAALNSGNPFQIGDRSGAVSALRAWGSPSFADWYLNANSDGTTGGGSGSSGKAPHAHSGWQHLRTVVNHRMPKALRQSEQHTAAALRALGKGRKVRH